MPAKKKPAKKNANKGGRPSAFDRRLLKLARELAENGLTDSEIAEKVGVCERTINNWKKSHPEFLQSLKEGKVIADERVVRSLFERATGYSHPEVHVSNFQGTITLTPLVKHYPPDTTAAIFWLKNRRPDEWRDKTEVDQTTRVVPMTGEQLQAEMQQSPVFRREIEELLAKAGVAEK